ncbi:hypothetical protein QCE62_15465 [Caballeronia sp. LZ033]|uniref:hypothetical protein n=1 Tax=Caballeronia sp. LZ033 TaxID=3038566 RepID=UPI00285BF64C|nr:hypothetical protein [Caballeronia sp. LZ033]MDR5814980.1 hypothetical protein [Caballeronia sp. LZ033]
MAVGLSEAIDGIAKRIDLPSHWERSIERCAFSTLPYCGFDPEHNRIHRSQAALLAASLARSYRRWNAAADLHFCLSEAGDERPVWRNWVSTGRPVRLDPEESKRAMSFLELMSRDSEERLMAYLNGKFDAGLKQPRGLPPLFHRVDRHWVECLGFERGALIDFLDCQNVSHELVRSRIRRCAGAENLATGSGAATSIDESTSHLRFIYPELCDRERSLAARHSKTDAQKKLPVLRGEMADIIMQAWERSGRSDNAQTIFRQLLAIARMDPHPHPVVKVSEDGHVLTYKDKTATERDFTVNDVTSRLRTLKRVTNQ